MKLAAPNEMKRLDEIAIKDYGIPGILLMENAALHIARKACEMVSYDKSKKIIAIAGKGNNGGDAFAAARHLHQWGYPVSVISLTGRGSITGDAEVFLEIIEKIGVKISYTDHGHFLREELVKQNDLALIVDGIFGTGVHGEITGIFADAVRAVNESGAKILSVDIPTGVNGETGQICGVAVEACETVTFSLPKPGLWQYPGRAYAGNITVVDIGIPSGAFLSAGLSGELLEISNVADILPERAVDSHKGTFGKVLIITGSIGMTGAGTLAAKAAFKTGSGLVYLAVPKSLSAIYGMTLPEAITVPQPEIDGFISAESLEGLLSLSKTMDAVVIGPGLSAGEQVAPWVSHFVEKCCKPMIIDADALNVLSPDIFRSIKAPAVITPHPGEFSRLTGRTVSEIQKNRVDYARTFSSEFGITVVLKGAGTVIAYPDRRYNINASGHPSLAVAGSGDVLSGIMGSLLGQGLNHEEAAALAVFVHGRCGEVLAGERDLSGFTAGEICCAIPSVMSELKHYAKSSKFMPDDL